MFFKAKPQPYRISQADQDRIDRLERAIDVCETNLRKADELKLKRIDAIDELKLKAGHDANTIAQLNQIIAEQNKQLKAYKSVSRVIFEQLSSVDVGPTSNERARKLMAQSYTIEAASNDDGCLFEELPLSKIYQRIKEDTGIEFQKPYEKLLNPNITDLGLFNVDFDLGYGTTGSFKLWVVPTANADEYSNEDLPDDCYDDYDKLGSR